MSPRDVSPQTSRRSVTRDGVAGEEVPAEQDGGGEAEDEACGVLVGERGEREGRGGDRDDRAVVEGVQVGGRERPRVGAVDSAQRDAHDHGADGHREHGARGAEAEQERQDHQGKAAQDAQRRVEGEGDQAEGGHRTSGWCGSPPPRGVTATTRDRPCAQGPTR